MRKLKRPKVRRDWLEGQVYKYERRIQRLVDEMREVIRAIEILDAQEAVRKAEKTALVNTELIEAVITNNTEENDAVHRNTTSEGFGSESSDAGEAGGSVRPSVHTDVAEMGSQS